MSQRCLLHKNKLEKFKQWLINNGWEIKDTKGFYEVLRATKEGRKTPLIVYTKANAKEYYSVMDKDYVVVKQFIRKG